QIILPPHHQIDVLLLSSTATINRCPHGERTNNSLKEQMNITKLACLNKHQERSLGMAFRSAYAI
ncbi:hypothetical protein, partial [Xenorhabdus bovienii]|uniref:hypothetical protein n=1 Tax=Xenorhabdus bovienii TaxID=40576 RepID=UPI003DA2ECB4